MIKQLKAFRDFPNLKTAHALIDYNQKHPNSIHLTTEENQLLYQRAWELITGDK